MLLSVSRCLSKSCKNEELGQSIMQKIGDIYFGMLLRLRHTVFILSLICHIYDLTISNYRVHLMLVLRIFVPFAKFVLTLQSGILTSLLRI